MSKQRMELHTAMQRVLLEMPRFSATFADVAEANRKHNLYRCRNGSHPKAKQIEARARKYPALFDVENGIVRLTRNFVVVRYFFRSLHYNVEGTSLIDTLEHLQAAIDKSRKRIAELKDESTPEEVVVDIGEEESQYIDRLLGAAMVLVQAYVTAVVSTAIKLARRYPHLKLPAARKELMALGPRLPRRKITVAQAADGLANYFKHREEWSMRWKRDHRNEETVTMIRLLGAKPGTEVLSLGLRSMRCDNDVWKLGKAVESWGNGFLSEFRNLTTIAIEKLKELDQK